MNRNTSPLKLDTLPVLLVYLIFAVSALVTLMMGVRSYKSMTDIINYAQEEQTSLAYIFTKVRSSDIGDHICLEDFGGLIALSVKEEYDGILYKTLIYCFEGYVYELFFEEGLDFMPEDGMPVIRCEALSFEAGEGVIKVSAGEQSIIIQLRTYVQGAAEIE